MDNRGFAWVATNPFPLDSYQSYPEIVVDIVHCDGVPVQAIEEKPTRTVYLPFTRAEHDTIYFGNMPIDPMGIHRLEEHLKSANIVLQLVKMTDQDATDFKGFFQWYINYLNVTLYTPETMLRNTTGLWKEHMRRLGANV